MSQFQFFKLLRSVNISFLFLNSLLSEMPPGIAAAWPGAEHSGFSAHTQISFSGPGIIGSRAFRPPGKVLLESFQGDASGFFEA
jgi:hypothetical protein